MQDSIGLKFGHAPANFALRFRPMLFCISDISSLTCFMIRLSIFISLFCYGVSVGARYLVLFKKILNNCHLLSNNTIISSKKT